MSLPSGNSLAILTTLLANTHSFVPAHNTCHPSTALSTRRLPGGSNHNDKPAWMENAEYWARQEQLDAKPTSPARNKTPAAGIGDHIGGVPLDRSPWDDDGGNTFAHLYHSKSTDEFKLPFENQRDIMQRMQRNQAAKGMEQNEFRRDVTENGSVPEWFGKKNKNQQQQLGDGRKNAKHANDKRLGGAHDVMIQLNGFKSKSASPNERNERHSNDDFRRPYDGPAADSVPEWFGSNTRSASKLPVNRGSISQDRMNVAEINPYGEEGKRHSFQMSTTDDFRKPYGMPDQQPRQLPPEKKKQTFKSPFQTSTTEDFRRISDTGTSASAPQQPIYAEFAKTPERSSPAWKNSVGQDAYESTQPPHSKPLGGVDTGTRYKTNNSQSSAILTVKEDNNALTTQQRRKGSSSRLLLRSIQWVNPSSDAPQYPLLLTRLGVTILATICTRYLHLMNGFSPVLAASAVSYLVSTCYDKRLGQVALCGALAGMSGGHLLPNTSMAVMLACVTSACYEVFILMSNSFSGIGGRIGATAFLATSIMAKYQRVNYVGRKLRRSMWKAGVGPSSILVSMALFHIFGALSTILLRLSSEDDGVADPVRASSVVGILGSLFIQDPTSLMALYGGSFVGMSLPSRLIDGNLSRDRIRQSATSLISSFAGAGAIAGLLHAVTMHRGYWNGGWGGKAGLCALAGCWMYRGLDNIIRFNKK